MFIVYLFIALVSSTAFWKFFLYRYIEIIWLLTDRLDFLNPGSNINLWTIWSSGLFFPKSRSDSLLSVVLVLPLTVVYWSELDWVVLILNLQTRLPIGSTNNWANLGSFSKFIFDRKQAAAIAKAIFLLWSKAPTVKTALKIVENTIKKYRQLIKSKMLSKNTVRK